MKIPSSTRRGGIGFLPPPGFRFSPSSHSLKASDAVLLTYSTRADVLESSSGEDDVPDSFVGYAAMAWYGAS
jgi:hypothetical protein